MRSYKFENGDVALWRDKAIVVSFAAARRVLSTAPLGGGLREDLICVFNQDCKLEGVEDTPLKAATYSGHMAVIADELGLDPALSCGLSTAADMCNAAIVSNTYLDTSVTAIVTAGIDINGSRVGDPALWHESCGEFYPASGTINILLFINASLTPDTLVRSLITCTEAKTAALQELLAPSLFSNGIATGSGTDGTAIICDPSSPVKLTCAGQHCKLGELVGRTTISAVKEALFLQTGLCAARQADIFSRMGRFGITESTVLGMCADAGKSRTRLLKIKNKSEHVVLASLYAHIMDQLQWGLISPQAALPAVNLLLGGMGAFEHIYSLPPAIDVAIHELAKVYSLALFELICDG
ncbi:MAG: adenosylcobinamide amidohydrolase [Clostridia bacterium]